MLTPQTFLKLRVHHPDSARGLSGLCVGYEREKWRVQQFAKHIIDWIPDFALSTAELLNIQGGNMMDMVRKATRAIYETDKYHLRGEFGEIILHALIKSVFGSVPVVKKIYFKDGNNEVVKGFDAVHVVSTETELELWLGESKFYDDVNRAIRDVIDELEKHLGDRYLRGEFAAITNKIDPDWPHYDRLKLLLQEETSLDEVFTCLRIPVLLTYDSTVVKAHRSICESYESAFAREILHYGERFSKKLQTLVDKQGFEVRVHLFLIPLEAKKELLDQLNTRLRAAQSI